MAFGDVGGSVTELVITCETPDSGTVDITKGDAVKLIGGYTVTNETRAEDRIFGEALADAKANGAAIPVKIRGISIFDYVGNPPVVDGLQGVVASDVSGCVKCPATGNGVGINVKVDTVAEEVHVLL